jgi:hypothetical protein
MACASGETARSEIKIELDRKTEGQKRMLKQYGRQHSKKVLEQAARTQMSVLNLERLF